VKRCFLLAVLILSLTLALGGCWNRREISSLAFVMAAGLDKGRADDQVTLTVQILKPGEVRGITGMGGRGSSSSQAVWVAQMSGQTVFDAVRKFTFLANRKLFWPFSYVLIIGEEMAKAGIAPHIDFFDRDYETRRNLFVAVAKGPAAAVIQARHEQEKIPAQAIEQMIKAGAATSMVPVVRLNDFLKALASKSSQPFAPAVEVFYEEKQEGEVGNETEEEKKVLRFKTGGAAVFKEDKLAGWLDIYETRGLLWVLGKVKSGILVVPAPGRQGHDVSLEIIRAESKIKPELKDGRVIITVEVKEDSNLGDQTLPEDLARPEMFELLEQAQARAIEREIRAAIQKARAWGVDIFGFGEAVHRKYPKEWRELEKRWGEVFPDIEVNIVVKAKVSRLGLKLGHVKSE